MELVSMDRIGNWSDLSVMKEMTCKNHPTARYLTKNPSTRGLHFVTVSDEGMRGEFEDGKLECPCPFSDLMVIVGPGTVLKEETVV